MAKSSLSPYSPGSAGASAAPRLVHRAEFVRPAGPSLANLWQMPLLLLSLGLFTLAAYVFIDPRPARSLQHQLAIAERDIDAQRYDAAIGRLNDLLAVPSEPAEAVATHLLVAEAIDRQIQRNRRQESPQAHRRIIREIQAAYSAGMAATTVTSDRLARSHEALGEIDEATANYRRAVELLEQDGKPEQAVPMRRSEIELLVAFDRQVSGRKALEAFLGVPGLTDDERAWALGELARISIDADRPGEARSFLAAAMALSPDDAIRGQVSFRHGYAAWKLGEHDQAEIHLALSRQQLGPGHPLEAEACYLLGRIAQDRQQFADAETHYQTVLRDHPDSRAAPRAQLASGTVKLLAGEDDERAAAQIAALASELAARPVLAPLKPEVIESLQRAGRILDRRGRHELALQMMDHEQALGAPAAEFFLRRAECLEHLADEAAAALAAAPATADDRPARETRLRDLLGNAGEAHVAAALRLRAELSPAYADVLWKGVSLLERAAEEERIVTALAQFTTQHPDDRITPVALVRLGKGQLALGSAPKAMESFMAVRTGYPGTDAAVEAGPPLAQALVAQGPDRFAEAQDVLRGIVENATTPDPIRRQALWDLGHLCYRLEQYEEALARLEQFARHESPDPADPAAEAQLAFLMADSQRKDALQKLAASTRPPDPLRPLDPDAQLAAAGAAPARRGAMAPAVRKSLEGAKQRFDQAIELYRTAPGMEPVDRDYERLAHFYRAACLYELERFEEAIELYGVAAQRYGDDASALAACIQIANACTALGRTEDAALARERATWLLKRLGPEALTDTRFGLSRDYWEQWLATPQATGAG